MRKNNVCKCGNRKESIVDMCWKCVRYKLGLEKKEEINGDKK